MTRISRVLQSFGVLAVMVVMAALVTPSLVPAVAQDDTPTVDPLTGQPVEQPEPEPEEPAGPDLREANEKVREQDYAGAEQLLVALREEFPDSADLLLMLGEVMLAQGKAKDALDPLERTTELDPERKRVHFQLASAYVATGKGEEAIEAFGKELALNEDPQIRRMAHLNRYMLFDRDKKYAEAAGELEQVLTLNPEEIQVFGEMATLHLKAGDTDSASATLERGLEAGFRSAAHYYSLGARLFKGDKHDAALAAFSKAIEIDPQMAPAERSLAATLDKMGREEEAVAHLKRYLELKPDAPDAAQISERIKAAEKG